MAGLADLNFFAADDAEQLKLIVFFDDDLRRTFVPQRQIQEVRPDSSTQIEEKFHVRQRAASSGPAVRTVGPIVRIEPFDEFGRRTVAMNTVRGPVDIIQGITEITPQWTKVEGITYMWDMRIATSSIPRDVLHKVLLRQVGRCEEHRPAKENRSLLPASGAVQGGAARSWRPSSGLSGQHRSEGAIGPDDPLAAATRRGAVARRVEAAAAPPASTAWCFRC